MAAAAAVVTVDFDFDFDFVPAAGFITAVGNERLGVLALLDPWDSRLSVLNACTADVHDNRTTISARQHP